jgi:DNA-binding MarR family transcriptional regulator
MHSIEKDDPSVLPALVREIYALGRVNRELQRRAVPEHPPACLQALGLIGRGDANRVSDIADQLRIDLSVASRQVAVLEASGWVTRATDPADGRARRLEATESGRAVLTDTLARMADAYTGVLEGWSEDELRALHTTLSRLREDSARRAEPALAAGAS